MKIVRGLNSEKIRFKEVPIGNIFEDGGEFYLKVECGNIRNSEVNAISISSGFATVFSDPDVFVRCIPNATLTV